MRELRTNTLSGRDDLTTRRTSLLALGGAALATLASRAPETAAKKNKKSNKKAEKRCRKQGPACAEFATEMCELIHALGPGRDACLDRANACCASIEECNGGAYFDCLFEQLADIWRR